MLNIVRFGATAVLEKIF